MIVDEDMWPYLLTKHGEQAVGFGGARFRKKNY